MSQSVAIRTIQYASVPPRSAIAWKPPTVILLAVGILMFSMWLLIRSSSLLHSTRGSAAEIALAQAKIKQKQANLSRKLVIYSELIQQGRSNWEADEAKTDLEISTLELQYLSEPRTLSPSERNGIVLSCAGAGVGLSAATVLLIFGFRSLRRPGAVLAATSNLPLPF